MRLTPRSQRRRLGPGQTLTEFAIVFPLFILVLFSIIVFGLFVFYNQQLENAAREAARFAAVHSASAQCPTVSRLDPKGPAKPLSYVRCDAPEVGWPEMTGAARSKIWGMDPSLVALSACWSGFVDPTGDYDALPVATNSFTDCTINGVNPQVNAAAIKCPPDPTVQSSTTPPQADGDDKASALAAVGSQNYPTRVTVYTCFNWAPPMSGFVLIPSQITLRATFTEVVQRQQ